MSDTDPSGAETTAAVTASAPSTPPPPTTPLITFSNSRGSGLARGKRTSSPSPHAASGAPAVDYKPTAVSIVTAPTEYKNPFAPPAPTVEAVAPEANTPSPVVAPSDSEVNPSTPLPTASAAEASSAPMQVSASVPPEAVAPAPVAEVPVAPTPPPAEDLPAMGGFQPADVVENAPKPELKILPPETPRRVEQSWESKSFSNVAGQSGNEAPRPDEGRSAGPRPYREDRRGDRPYYRSDRERRDNRPGEFRDPRPDSDPQNRPSYSDRGQDAPASAPAPAAAPEPKKSGGMFGWVKKLFASSPVEAPKPEPQPETRGERPPNQDGPYRRRRHRGGRGRNFQGDQRGPREGQPGGQPGDQSGGQPSGDQRGYGGDQRGYGGDQRQQGNRRRHRHGGGGGFRGNGRPEGGPPPTGS